MYIVCCDAQDAMYNETGLHLTYLNGSYFQLQDIFYLWNTELIVYLMPLIIYMSLNAFSAYHFQIH